MGKQIMFITKLLLNEYSYVSYRYISEKLNISIRTVARYIKDLDQYLNDNDIKLDVKKGMGIKLDISEEKRRELTPELTKDKKSYLSISERKIIIICELLKADESIKSYYFSSILKVSLGTITRDLDEVEDWLKQNGLKLNRFRGNGLFIEGPETSYRTSITNLLISNIDDKNNYYYSMDFMSQDLFKDSLNEFTKTKLAEIIDHDIVLGIKTIVDDFDNNLKELLVDEAYFKFIIFLSLIIQRKDKEVIIDEGKILRIESIKQYDYITKLVKEIEKNYNIIISKSDIYTITVNFVTSRTRTISEKKGNPMNDFDLLKITFEIIFNIQKDLNIRLDYDNDLFNRLMTHIKLLISRAYMDIKVNNKFLGEVKQDYKKLFEVVKKNVAFLSEIIDKEISDEEVAYITIHIAGTLAAADNKSKLIRAVVVCMSGIGTSKILVEKLKQQNNNIEVVTIMSISEVNEVELFKQGIDLIISSINIDTLVIPTVVVNPFIKEDDRLNLYKTANQIAEKKNIISQTDDFDEKKLLKNNVNEISTEDITYYLKLITRVIDDFYFEEDIDLDTKPKLIEHVSKQISSSSKNQKSILDKLIKREQSGSTVVDDTGIILLHCKSDDNIKLGLARLNEIIDVSLFDSKEEISTALIMLVPENADDKILKIFSRLSKELIENNDFTDILTNGTKEEVLKRISKILLKFISAII